MKAKDLVVGQLYVRYKNNQDIFIIEYLGKDLDSDKG